MFIAIDIGGTKTLIAAYSEAGEILRSQKHPTNPDFNSFIDELLEVVAAVAANDNIDAICVAAPGRIDYDRRVVLGMGNLGWKNVDLVTPLAEKFQAPVAIDNDANLGAVGEANMGIATDYETVLYITVSTGIGTGLTHKGLIPYELRKSEGGSMHFRHQGELVKWESFASGKAFVAKYGKLGSEVDDPEIWREYAEDLSLGFGSLIAVLEPEVIVVGGGMGEHLDKFQEPLMEALGKIRSDLVKLPVIIEAKYPNEAVINGCYVICKRLVQE